MTAIRSTDEDENAVAQRDSSINVKWWQVIGLFVAAMSFVFLTLIAHESRITKTETSQDYIVKAIERIDKNTESINEKLTQHMVKND